MKNKIIVFSFIFVLFMVLLGCNNRPENPNAFVMDKDTSYALGMYFASEFQIPDVHYDYRALMEGFRDFNEMQETRFSMDQAFMLIQVAFEQLTMREALLNEPLTDAELTANLEAGRLFLEQNGRRPGIVTTSSGLQYEIIVQGTGARPSVFDFVQVHYEGTLIDGTVFDSSYERGEAAIFPLGEVIPGWTEGFQLLNEGSTAILYIPSDLAYGQYTRNMIPGNSVLVFRVEFLSILTFDF